MNLYMISLGCAKNQVDTEMILGLTEKNGFSIISEIEEADVIMINTCAFIESAKKEAIDTILDCIPYKESGAKIVVLGCLSQRYKKDMERLIPEVDYFVSIDEYANLSEILKKLNPKETKFSGCLSSMERIYSTDSYTRYVKISDGCLNRCAFCAIPLIRGKLKSRTIDDIVNEVKMHVSEGVYEINLISQDTTRYGYDIYKKNSIVDLLKELVKIEGDFKIRLLYLYPKSVSNELIDFIALNPKVMHYFDIPIQHSEDKILLKMKRLETKTELVDLFKRIRAKISDAVIRTTVIVGFPTEDKDDVSELIEFIKEVRFDHLGAFMFSKEEGTVAATYKDDVSKKEKKHRYELVMTAQNEISAMNNISKIGKVFSSFVTGYDEESFMYKARSYAYAPDDIDGMIYFAAKKEHKLGDIVNVKILDSDAYSLTGEEIDV